MKRFEITYKIGLGDFLDSNNIEWTVWKDNTIIIYCKDENTFFDIAVKFALSD